MWVRGLKPLYDSMTKANQFMSHPMWVRGLKLRYEYLIEYQFESHPMWVRGLKQEIAEAGFKLSSRRTPCGCVD